MKAEEVHIVDEEDRVIGSKLRSELDYSKDIYRVSGLWVTNPKGDILIAQRSFSKKNSPGKWMGAVAGTVESHESYEDNIYKEAEEELGIVHETFVLGPKFFKTGVYKFFVQVFLWNTERDIDSFSYTQDEVESIQWFPKDTLKEWVDRSPEDFTEHFAEYLRDLSELT